MNIPSFTILLCSEDLCSRKTFPGAHRRQGYGGAWRLHEYSVLGIISGIVRLLSMIVDCSFCCSCREKSIGDHSLVTVTGWRTTNYGRTKSLPWSVVMSERTRDCVFFMVRYMFTHIFGDVFQTIRFGWWNRNFLSFIFRGWRLDHLQIAGACAVMTKSPQKSFKIGLYRVALLQI